MSKVCKYHESIKCRNDGECDGCKVAPHGNTLDPVVSEHPTSHHIKCWLGFGPAKTERENMAIRKAYEISCDECGLAEPAHGNKSVEVTAIRCAHVRTSRSAFASTLTLCNSAALSIET